MRSGGAYRSQTPAQILGELSHRLQERRPEIEQVTFTRVCSIADPRETGDPGYALGLKKAVGVAVGLSIAALTDGEEVPVPVELSAQARLAAQQGVGLDTVLRRYFAGHALLSDLLMREAEQRPEFGVPDLQHLVRVQSALLERVMIAITAEYKRQEPHFLRSPAERRADKVKRLLAGEAVDVGEIAYDFSGAHLGIAATGPGAVAAIRDLAANLDRRLLLCDPGGGTIWGWLGGREAPDTGRVLEEARSSCSAAVTLAIGELGRNLPGWHLTHRQAVSALMVALRGEEAVVRYAEVALLAAALRDEVLASSLRSTYLEPLTGEPDGGAALKQTLREYFASGGHISSTSAALGVSRQTVSRRLRIVEELVGRRLVDCAADVATALDLGDVSN